MESPQKGTSNHYLHTSSTPSRCSNLNQLNSPAYATKKCSRSSATQASQSNNNQAPTPTAAAASSSNNKNLRKSSSTFQPIGLTFSSTNNVGSFIPPGILSPHLSTTAQSANSSPLGTHPLCVSPNKPRYSDRFIPARAGNTWHLTYPTSPTVHAPEGIRPLTPHKRSKENQENNKEGSALYSCLLMNEVLGYQFEDNKELGSGTRKATPNRKLFNFDSTDRSVVMSGPWSPYSLSPISHKSEKLLRSPKKPTRRISKVPFKVLDAPELQDDFYLNLVDWSSQNVLSVGLGTCVYLWSACTSQVTRLCDLAQSDDTVTSVSWNERGSLVAVGTQAGLVQVWDAAAGKQVSTFRGHTARVGAIAWNGDLLSSGSRDRFINQKDIREPPAIQERQLVGHRQEVCGLKWSPDNQSLASGGNDNRLYVWNLHSTVPVQQYTEHLAAVKAIAWSPHHHGLLASGGGTADRCIRFWNTLTAQPMQSVDTGSQVCNLAWSKHSSELVSTHGYSQNQVLVWKYPSLQQVAKLTGHSYRVLYLAMSPDGEAIVTGAGDETLRFWNVFSKNRSQKENKSSLNLYNSIR